MTPRLHPAWYFRHQSPRNRGAGVVKSLVDEGNQPFSTIRFEEIHVLLQLVISRRLVREKIVYYPGVLHDRAVTRFHGPQRAVEIRSAVPFFLRKRRADSL